jgi:sec-independent protein translocase protein TatA
VTLLPIGFLSMGLGEMLVIGLVALLIFGGRLPVAMRDLGRAYAKFRRSLNEVARPLREEIRRLDQPTPKTRRPSVAPPKPDVEAAPYQPEALEAKPAPSEPVRPEPPPEAEPASGSVADEPPTP